MIDSLEVQSNAVVAAVGELPKLDMSAAGDPPVQPNFDSLTSAVVTPFRPPGPPSEWTREQLEQFKADIEVMKAAQQALMNAAHRYKRNVERHKARRQRLREQYVESFRDAIAAAGTRAGIHGEQAGNVDMERARVEALMDRAVAARAPDSGSHGQTPSGAAPDSASPESSYEARMAEQDAELSERLLAIAGPSAQAMSAAMEFAADTDSMYASLLALRLRYDMACEAEMRSTGFGSPGLTILSRLVANYATLADSFRATTVRRYGYIVEHRTPDSGSDFDPEFIEAGLRLLTLDPAEFVRRREKAQAERR